MKAITIWQPWATLIAIGAKKYETRSWATNYRGPIAIHAAQKPFNTDTYLDRELYPFAKALNLPDIYSFDKLPYGCIIATAELIGCWEICVDGGDNGWDFAPTLDNSYHATKQEMFFGDWTPGRYAWQFRNMKMLPEPIKTKGHQRLWNWEAK